MCIKMTKSDLIESLKNERITSYYKCGNCGFIMLVRNIGDTADMTCCRCGNYSSMEKIEIIEDALPSG